MTRMEHKRISTDFGEKFRVKNISPHLTGILNLVVFLVAGRLDAVGSFAEEFGFGRSLGLCPNAKEGSNLGFVTGAMA